MVISLALLIVLQSTNLWKTFTIASSADLLLLYALSSLNFIAFVIFGFIFLRSIIRLIRERRTFELGAKIKTRLLIYFVALSLLPIIAMAVFSYLFLNRALERWFSQIPNKIVEQSRQVQDSAISDRASKLQAATRMLAITLDEEKITDARLKGIADAGNLSYIAIVDKANTLASYRSDIPADQQPELESMLELARTGNVGEPALSDGIGFDVGSAPMSGERRLILVPDPIRETALGQMVDTNLTELDRLRQEQLNVRLVGLLTLGVLTFLLIFASTWIAFYVARGLTSPIKALAEGAGEIAMGNLGHRVDVLAEDELAILVQAFNKMASQLETSSAELSARRHYIETILETLPTGVVSVDEADRVTTINTAASQILGAGGGATLTDIVDVDDKASIARLIQRARRVGHASDQVVVNAGHVLDGGGRTVAITAAALPEGRGVVVVLEDLSELIAAQRASAWQEVARRMAHEIKNPLTPIQLSAERIAKRFDRAAHAENGSGKRIDDKGPISDVVHESTDTIIREVASLKMLVDEFSRFARLPTTKLGPGDIKEVIHQAVASFDGHSPKVEISYAENGYLPEIMLDPEQLRRVYVNLIGNAVEAFDPEATDKRVVITARHDTARDLIVSEVSDNGRGIAAQDLQKLFLPYFSTKGRGTGLGLAIVKRIISEHHGRINVAANHPNGARFTIELPVNA